MSVAAVATENENEKNLKESLIEIDNNLFS